MENVFDIFNADAFGVISLTDAINRQPFQPGQAGRLGIFEEEPVNTAVVAIEEEQGLLSLVPNTPRGGPAYENARNRAKMRLFTVPHFPIDDAIYPDEVQGVRLFGAMGAQLATVEAVVQKRQRQMTPKLDATVEYGRIGAIKGNILDADGSTVIYNLFTEFSVSQPTLDFVLGTTTTNQLANVITVKRSIESELGQAQYDHIHCFAGQTWFSRFVSHPTVSSAFQYWRDTQNQLGAFLRSDLRYEGFQFGGVVFEEYRGNVGGVPFVADSEAYFFPVGVPNLFKTYFAPADWMETVNTMGLPRYSKQWLDPNGGKFVRVETQTNPLSICTRPGALLKGTTSN
jgi:hypothetical protein